MIDLHYVGSLEATDELYALVNSPDTRVYSYTGCVVNEIKFQIENRDVNRKTQNSGVSI